MYSILCAEDSWKILLTIVSSLSLIYWLLTKNFNYWSKIGVKGPKPIPIFGNSIGRVFNQTDSDMKYMNTFGKVYGIFFGTKPVLELTDPKLIKQILVKDFHYFVNKRVLNTDHPLINKSVAICRDEDWKRIRSLMSSGFSSGKMKKIYGLVRKCIQEYVDELDVLVKQGKDVDVKLMYECLTMNVIASYGFALDSNTNKDLNNAFLNKCRKLLEFNLKKIIPLFIFPKFLLRLFNITSVFNESANQWIFNLVRHLLEKRRKGEKNNDFLQFLIDAKVEESNIRDKNDEFYANEGIDEIAAKNKAFNSNFSKTPLTEDEIVAQCWTFIVGAFLGIADVLAYTSYELALSPDCQQKLYSELMSSIESNHEISYETLQELPYLDAVINEALRLYPINPRVERVVNVDYDLGDTGIKIMKGQLIEIPVYAIHHSELYYENAQQFNPDRFLAENRHKLVPYTYLPFGTGPRNCIGMQFSILELKLAIAHIVMRYRLTQCDRTATQIQFQKLTPFISTKNVILGFEAR